MKKDKIMIEVLENSKKEIENLKNDFKETAKFFYSGDLNSGFEKIKFLSDILSDFFFFWNDAYIETGNAKLYEINEKFSKKLSEALEEIKKNDFIKVGDFFYFEFQELLDRYNELIPELKKEINKKWKN
jgi:hypothetical protein